MVGDDSPGNEPRCSTGRAVKCWHAPMNSRTSWRAREGKTLIEARGEVVRAGQILKYYAGSALQPHGQALDSVRPGVEVTVTREPVGVVTAITPWNFPIAIPAWKIAPALAYGNTVVLKPAELVPACAWGLVDILNRAGLPRGAQPRPGSR